MEKETEQVPGERDKEITVQFDEDALNKAVEEESLHRTAEEGLMPRGDVGLPEAAREDQLAAENKDDDYQTSDMNSAGDTDSEDEGVPGGLYAQDERGEGVEKLPSWDTGSTNEGTENSERVTRQ